jgi:selenocysteine lyase/cysteine desulfurase
VVLVTEAEHHANLIPWQQVTREVDADLEFIPVDDATGEILWDTHQPDGNPRRLLDVSRLSNLGWKAGTQFREGVEKTYRWFLENRATARV